MFQGTLAMAALRQFDIAQNELGIGDIVCSLYALYGFAVDHGFPPIRLHMADHRTWLELVEFPGLQVLPWDDASPPHIDFRLGDTEEDYRAKLASGVDPKLWYARKLATTPRQPPVVAATRCAEAPFAEPYVVLAPFATRINRTWEIHHWRILARELMAAGYEVIALDAPHQPERCKEIGVRYFWGQPALRVGQILRHASLLVSCDSGMAHVAGLFDTPTVVVLTQQEPEKYYSMTGHQFAVPKQPCVRCRFQPALGYEEKCDFGCWALQSLSPVTVARQCLELLGAANADRPGCTGRRD